MRAMYNLGLFFLAALLGVTLAAAGTLEVRPVALDCDTPEGVSLQAKTLTLTNNSSFEGAHYNIAIISGSDWLELNGSAGGVLAPGSSQVLDISLHAEDLGLGPYIGMIELTSAMVASGVTNFTQSRVIPVQLTVNPRPELGVSTDSILNMASEGEDAPVKIFQIWNKSGYYALNYSIQDNVPWVIPSVSRGTCTTQHDIITLDYSTAGLAEGTYTGLVTIIAEDPVSGSSVHEIALRLDVTGLAGLSCDGTAHTFLMRQGDDPATSIFSVRNTGTSSGTSLRWSVAIVGAQNGSWLSLTPSSGEIMSGDGTIDVVLACDPLGLVLGKYNAIVRVSAIDTLTGREARGSPYDMLVSLTLREREALHFGGEYGAAMVVYGKESGLWGLRDIGGNSAIDSFGGYDFCPAPGDYDGDGIADLGVYRASSGGWYCKRFGTQEVVMLGRWGNEDCCPVRGDFDGDGRQDFALYNETAGVWYALLSSQSYQAIMAQFGGPGYLPIAGDFDGDGLADPILYNPTDGSWHGLLSDQNYQYVKGWFGGPGMIGFAGDFNGNGRSDIGVYHQAAGSWYILGVDGAWILRDEQFGGPGWAPVVADYDGDGIDDLAIYNEGTGRWRIRRVDGTLLAWDVNWGGYGYQAIGK